MPLGDYINDLIAPEFTVTNSGLRRLSSLLQDEQLELSRGWLSIPIELRVHLVDSLVELSEESFDLDFQAVFVICMEDPDAAIRGRGIDALWDCEDRRIIEPLLARIELDESDAVRAAAATILGQFARLATEGKLIHRDSDKIFNCLRDCLEDYDEPIAVRRRALEAIAPFATAEIDGWINWAHDNSDPLLRQSALFAMGKTGNDMWLSAAYAQLTDPDPGIRFEAINTVRELGDADAVRRISELLEDEDSEVALAAVHAVAAIGGATARKLLRSYSEDAALLAVQEAASEALHELEEDEADLSLVDYEFDSRD